MTGSDNPLCQGILDDARVQAEEKLAKAKAEAAKILEEAKDKAEAAAAVEKKSTSVQLESIRLKEDSAKRNIDRLVQLKNLDSGYDEIMAEVRAELDALYQDKARCHEILVRWTAEAAVGLGLTEAVCALPAAFSGDASILTEAEALVKEKTGSSVTLKADTRTTSSFGAVLSSPDGKVSYNNQIDTRLRRMQRDIKTIVQELTCKAE